MCGICGYYSTSGVFSRDDLEKINVKFLNEIVTGFYSISDNDNKI
jgi:hypothetical protein